MEFRVLGRLEVADGGRPIKLGGERQRALLAILLLGRGEVMSADRLIDDLYGADPPPTAPKSLQAHISRLRKALGPQAPLQRAGTGYVLDLSESELDAERFSRLLDQGRDALTAGRAEEAQQHFEGALHLWRGPPLADVAYADFAQGEIARLEELRLGAVEDLIDARLALGDGAVVSELRKLVSEHPLRERLRGLYMRALYRTGRQADALKQYQEAREALVEGLGVEPGHELHTLHQAILNQDPSLDGQLPSRVEAVQGEPEIDVIPTSARQARKTITALCVRFALRHGDGDGLDPEALRRLTSDAFAQVESAVQRHGGTVEILAGDAVTAVFGLAVVNEDDALRSLRAAVEIRDSLSDVELDFHVGVSSGEVVTGGDGSSQLRATGRPITQSAVLAQTADVGEILVDGATERLVRHTVIVEASNGASRVVSIAEPTQERVGRFSSPMIGRERERRRLHDAFEQAVSDSSCQLFTVLGLAGVGKSRLVREFLGDLAGRALVAHGRCLPYGEGITYWPLLEAITTALELNETDSPARGREKILFALDGEPAADAIAQRVAEMVGLAEGSASAEEGFRSARALFEAVARTQPLVLVFDDIHWGETTFLELVEYLADWVREAPILLLCLARPELHDVRPSWGGGKLNATTILLEPLSDGECAELIERLVGRAELTTAVRAEIAEAADGNPLFVEEMLSMLVDDGVLLAKGDGWVASEDVSKVRLPPTIQALLAARLDRLPEDERAAVEAAAVAGKVFYEDGVAELSPAAFHPGLEETLARLVRKELIRPQRGSLGGRTYRFRHLLIRDAAYEAIPKATRARLHERFGRWLEHAVGERSVEYEEVLGYHLERAYHYGVEIGPVDAGVQKTGREAARLLGSAGRRAFARGDAPAGLNLTSRAVAVLPAHDPMRVELVPNMRVIQGTTDLAWADKVLTEAVEAAATTGDRRLAASALVQRGFLRLSTDNDVTPGELIASAERAVAAFEEFDDELGLARSWRLLAQAHYLDRRLEPATDAFEQALLHSRRAGDRFEEHEIVEWLVIALFLGPMPAPEAAERCKRLLEEVRGNPVFEAEVSAGLALIAAMLGNADDANGFMARSHALMREAGEQIWIVPFWLCHVHLWRDDPLAAERELRPAYEALKGRGHKSHFSSYAQALARIECLLGRFEEAVQLTYECEQASSPNDVHSQILWRSTRGSALARQGDLEAGERLVRDAVAFAARGDFLPAHAQALMDMADVLELVGRSDQAADAVREALRLYEQKGNVPTTRRARDRLARLQA
jgi:DNA-binding SARP family transcriptional activator